MKFCPTPGEPDISQAQKDLDSFHLRIKWRLHFSNPPDPADATPNYNPPCYSTGGGEFSF